VLFVVLDGVSPRHVNETVMPELTSRARAGGWCRAGIPGVMPTSTYPNHATFVTGVVPARHGVVANEIPTPTGTVPAWERGPSVPTLFDSMRAAGRPSAAVFGDDHLVGVTGAAGAGYLWPKGGFDAGVATDILGYAKDRETTARILEAVTGGAELIVAQLNETDTAGHLFGPDSPEALHRYHRADSHLGEVLTRLADRWEEWVVVAAWTTEVPGVEGIDRIDDDTVLVWAEDGRWFSSVEFPVRGVHGSPRTAPQVAVVTGGHPATGPLAAALGASPASSTWWAPAVAGVLGVTAPSALEPASPGAAPARA